MIAFDASAVLALLYAEPGQEVARSYLRGGLLSTVNLGEVHARFARDGHDVEAVRPLIEALRLKVVPFSASQARLSASLVTATRPRGLSLGDRACLALALERGVPALTADRVWSELDVRIDVVCVR